MHLKWVVTQSETACEENGFYLSASVIQSEHSFGGFSFPPEVLSEYFQTKFFFFFPPFLAHLPTYTDTVALEVIQENL